MTDLKRSIEYNVDQSAINKAKEEIKKLEAQEKKLATAVLEGGDAFEENSKKLAKVQREQRQISNALRALGQDFNTQEKDVESATRALDAYEDKLRSVQRGGADLSGDFASSFAGLRGAGTAFSGGNAGAVGGGFEIAEAFADIGEFVPRLKAQADVLGTAIRENDSIASRFASSAGDAISGLTGMSAGTATLGAVALPVVATLAALAFVMNDYNKKAEEQRVQLEATIEALRNTNVAIAEGLTSDQAQAEIERLNRLREAEQQSLGELNTAYEGIQDGLTDALGGIVGNIVGAGVRVFDSREQEIADAIRESESTIAGYTTEIRALEASLEDGSLATNDAIQAEEQLETARQEQATQAQALIAQLEQANNRANQLETQRLDIIENNAIASANASELEAVEKQIANENALIKEQQHQDKLADIRQAGQERIEQLEQELNALPTERYQELAKVAQSGNDKLSELQQDYQSRTSDSYEDFTKQLSRSTSDASKSIRRLAEDIQSQLDDATRANDVEAFLRAEAEGEKRLRREKEDANTQEQRAIDDFVQGREREREAFNKKQADVLKGIEAERQKVIESYNERRQALAQSIEQERVAIEERIKATQQAYQEQLRLEAIRAEQQQRRQAVLDRQQEEAFNRRLQEIQQERQAQIMASNEILAAIARIQSSARGISFGNGSQPSAFNKPSMSSNNPFAKGGNVFNINNSSTVGDIASTKQVNEANQRMADSIVQNMGSMFDTVVNGR